ncbi:MAG: 4-hydroxy-tetrahydrodipicolinate synthase [Actinomycetota bacterium]|nr:4-hydroxy-tetrahydrodipicolinate synthase [Actinomycetota bacterium]
MARFGEVVTAMVTPFDDDLALDLDAAVALARWLTDHGSDGLVLAGSTGEGTSLSDAEKLDLFRAVAEAVTVPVLAGTGTADTRHSVELTRAAVACGVAGVLVVAPYYSRPSQAGLDLHFRAVAEAAGERPVLLYDIPVRTGRRVARETLLALAREVPNVVGVKDAAGDPHGTARLVDAAPEGFEVYSGEDGLTLPLLAVGAVGVIGVAANWAPGFQSEVIAAFAKGDVTLARELNARLLPSFAFESSEAAPNPIPAKAALRHLGLRVGQCRPPLGPAPPGLDDQAAEVLSALG